MNQPLFRLISTESDLPRPRVLREGSLAACLDELKEAVLADAAACNRGTLVISVASSRSHDPPAAVVGDIRDSRIAEDGSA